MPFVATPGFLCAAVTAPASPASIFSLFPNDGTNWPNACRMIVCTASTATVTFQDAKGHVGPTIQIAGVPTVIGSDANVRDIYLDQIFVTSAGTGVLNIAIFMP